MLDAAQRVLDLYDEDEFQIFVIQGDNGYGKTTYANRIISEVYSAREQKRWNGDGVHGNWNIKMFKKHLGFHPVRVINQWYGMKHRDYVFHWDDAGMWLNAMDYHDPFVKSVGKYLQTARDDWACIIFSCIDKNDIINKIRSFRAAVIVDITKDPVSMQSKYDYHRNRRLANAWKYWESRLNKIGTENEWSEHFDSHVPNKFYEWYRPLRSKYTRMAKKIMRQKVLQHKDIVETQKISTI